MDAQERAKYSALRLRAGNAEPGSSTVHSNEVGWKSLRVQTQVSRGLECTYETVAIPDVKIAVASKGECETEYYSSAGWKSLLHRSGTCGLIPPMNTVRVRWKSDSHRTLETSHLFLPQKYMLAAAEEYRHIGSSALNPLPDVLAFSDPVVTTVVRSLVAAVRSGEPDIYADTAARFLATHLLSMSFPGLDLAQGRSSGNELTDRRLLRVLDFMQHRFRDSISVTDLAREAAISPFHFVRLFKKKIGMTPHRYLVQLRMQHAAMLLTKTDGSVLDIAEACGYAHTGHFSAAFQKQFGHTPSGHRGAVHGSYE